MMDYLLVSTFLLVSFGGGFHTHQVFVIPSEIRVSSEKNCTFRQYFTVSPDGRRAAFIDPQKQEIRSYELIGGKSGVVSPHTDAGNYGWGPIKIDTAADHITVYMKEPIEEIAAKGRRPGEVNAPIAVVYDRTGKLLVSDLGNRRVSVFGLDRKLESSFVLPSVLQSPSDIRETSDGNYLLSTLLLQGSDGLNAGYHCNVVSPSGKLLKSFAYTPKIAFDRNLWKGVDALFDLDDNGNIYVTFTVDPVIYVYSSAGELKSTFGGAPAWWVSPPKLDAPRFKLNPRVEGFESSWTRTVKLIYLGNNKLLRCAETNGLVSDCSKQFILDVYSTDGRLIAGGIESEYLPVGVDNDRMIYFLSSSGDSLLKASQEQTVGR